jgi:hypothetical protein
VSNTQNLELASSADGSQDSIADTGVTCVLSQQLLKFWPAARRPGIRVNQVTLRHAIEKRGILLLPQPDLLVVPPGLDPVGVNGILVFLSGSAQEFVGRAGIAELGLNSQFADG